MLDLPPHPSLWIPPKPAIIRAAGMPKRADFYRDVRKERDAIGVMPVFCPGHGLAMASVSVAYTGMHTARSAGSQSITLPAVIDGDVIFYGIGFINSGGTTAIAQPATATSIGNAVATGTTTSGYACSWEVLTTAMTGATRTATFSGGTSPQGFMDYIIFRPNVPATSVSVQSPHFEGTANAPAGQSITSGSGAAPSVVVVGWCAHVAVNTTQMTGTLFSGADAVLTGELSAGSFRSSLCYKIYNSSPADLAVAIADGGSSTGLCSFYFQFTP